MRYFAVLPTRDISNKWPGVVALFLLSLVFTGGLPSQAFAQRQEAAHQQSQPEITLVPVDMVSPVERAQKSGTALALSLNDVTKMALQSNLDIAIADTNEQIDSQKLIAYQAYYDPTLSLSSTLSDSNSANTQLTNVSSTGFINSTKTVNLNAVINKNIPLYGASLQGTWNSSRRNTNQTNDLFSPSYSTQGSLQYTQPLWRNLKIDSARNNLKVFSLNSKMTDSQFRSTLTSTISRIQQAYWNLVSVIQSYDVTRKSVELARITVENNRKKVEVGTSPPIDVTSSLATQASRELDLISAEERILSAQNALRQLITNDRNNEIWNKTIVPTDKPDYLEYNIDLNQAIETALKNRPELEQSSLNLAINDLTYNLQKENKKWAIGLTASLGGTGTAGPQSYSASGAERIAPQFVGGLWTSYKTVFTEGTYNWSLRFNVTVPLSTRDIDTTLAQTRIARQQLLMNQNKSEQSIIVDVRNSVQALNTARSRLRTAGVSRQLAEAQLDAENKRFEAGLSQNYLVLQRQNELSSAQLAEVNAMITYRTAIITLQQSMFTLLDASAIDVAKGSSKNVPGAN